MPFLPPLSVNALSLRGSKMSHEQDRRMHGQGRTYRYEGCTEEHPIGGFCHGTCDSVEREMDFEVAQTVSGGFHTLMQPALNRGGHVALTEVSLPEGGFHVIGVPEGAGLTDDERETAAYHMGLMGM